MDYTPFTKWVIDNGISEGVLELILCITIVATIVSIARYIVGSKTFGIYAPIILSVAYLFTGLKYGLVITAIVIGISLLSYTLLSKIRMHYIARIAINYSLMAIIFLLCLMLINYLGLGLQNMSLIQPLAIISIFALSDFFIKQYVKKGFKNTSIILLSTIVISALGWLIITREVIYTFLINNLWILPTLIILNIIIGQFSGLRLKDIFRFRSIIQDKENVKK
ncbi:MAG: 7TM domain-containing protein [Candidatus Dojkabacteria bacterium]|nr:7TM domain-containing protein [Candidatus Dojkabacteria bacterium]